MNTLVAVPVVPFAKRFRLFAILTLWSAVLGPLIGGAPYNWMLLPIPFSYLFGGIPALSGGALYGLLVITLGSHLRFTWITRLLLGAVCGAAGCALASLVPLGLEFVVLAVFGVPAGAVCALLYKQEWIEQRLFQVAGKTVLDANADNAAWNGR